MSITKSHLKSIILYSTLSLLLGLGSFFGTPSPLVIGLCTLAPVYCLPWILLTYSVYFLIFSMNIYSACIGITALIVSFVRCKFKLSHTKLIALAAGVLPLLLISTGLIFSVSVSHWLTLAVVLFCFTYLYGEKQSVSNMTAYVVIIGALSSLPIPIIDLGRALSVFSLLHIARLNDRAKSALFSIITAGALIMANPSQVYSILFICIGGTLISLISSESRLRQPLYFVCLSLIYAMLNLSETNELFFAVDAFIAASLYVFTFDSLGDRLFRFAVSLFKSQTVEEINGKIHSCSVALSSITDGLSQNRAELPKPPRKSTVAYSMVCSNCRKHTACFADKDIDLTALDTGNKSENVLGECIRKNDIDRVLSESEARYGYIKDKHTEQKQENTRTLLYIELIKSLISGFDTDKRVDITLSEELRKRLMLCISNVDSCKIYTDDSALIKLINSDCYNSNRILRCLHSLTGSKYKSLKSVKQNSFTYIFAYPEPECSADYALASTSASESGISGDIFTQCEWENCRYFILSDGMGTGEKAHNTAKKLSDCLTELLSSGIAVEPAIQLSSISTKYSDLDESFATFDILKIDLAKGEGELYKCGAADSYILGDDVSVIKGAGYPVGIFDRCFISYDKFLLSDNTEIVLASDGAEVTMNKITSALVNADTSDELCERLIPHNDVNMCETDDALVAVITVKKKLH